MDQALDTERCLEGIEYVTVGSMFSGIRTACDARHCGRRAFLHDDLDVVTLDAVAPTIQCSGLR